MRIADAREVREKQDMIHVTGKQIAPETATLRRSKNGVGISGVAESAESSKDSGVTLEISEDGKALQSDSQKQQDDAQWMQKWAQEMYQQQAESADKAAETFEDIAKVMEIARRISRGDRVPMTDEKKLLEFNADLYQAAKAAAVVNAHKKHKEHKSLFDEEEDGSMREQLRALHREKESADAEAVSSSMVAAPESGAAGTGNVAF